MKIWMFVVLLSGLIASCSSTKKEDVPKDQDNSETIKKDYDVVDASSNSRPGWIEDPIVWAGDKYKDAEKFRYFAFETSPKNDREMACSLAKTNLRVDVASEISTFIDKTLGASKEGNASSSDEKLKEFVEETLTEKVHGFINGASIIKTYWEKRKYQVKKGAQRDFTGYTCAALIKMENGLLKDAINRAVNAVVEKAQTNNDKEKVKKALDNLDEKFLKAGG